MNKSEKFWLPLCLLGMLPGFILWIVLYQVGFAGEYAGLLCGLGGIGMLRRSGAKLTKGRLFAGIVLLLALAFLANHVGYILDVYNNVNGLWAEQTKLDFSYSDAARIVYHNILLENEENMRTFYLEALIQGMLCCLLFWVGLFIYYTKLDKIMLEDGKAGGKDKESLKEGKENG